MTSVPPDRCPTCQSTLDLVSPYDTVYECACGRSTFALRYIPPPSSRSYGRPVPNHRFQPDTRLPQDVD